SRRSAHSEDDQKLSVRPGAAGLRSKLRSDVVADRSLGHRASLRLGIRGQFSCPGGHGPVLRHTGGPAESKVLGSIACTTSSDRRRLAARTGQPACSECRKFLGCADRDSDRIRGWLRARLSGLADSCGVAAEFYGANFVLRSLALARGILLAHISGHQLKDIS